LHAGRQPEVHVEHRLAGERVVLDPTEPGVHAVAVARLRTGDAGRPPGARHEHRPIPESVRRPVLDHRRDELLRVRQVGVPLVRVVDIDARVAMDGEHTLCVRG
jgi:hypothetical protein